MSGDAVFAILGNARDVIDATWARKRVRYSGASWGFTSSVVTWHLFHDGVSLARVGEDAHEALVLDELRDDFLRIEREPFVAVADGPNKWRVPYTLSGSNHFGSAILDMELRIDLIAHTFEVVMVRSFVDLD